MIIDIVIALAVIVSAWVGYQRGLVQPLLAEVFGLGALAIIVRNRDAFAVLAGVFFHASAFLAVLMAVVLVVAAGYLGARLGGAVHRMPAVRGVDGFMGIWMQTLIGLLVCYVLISGIIAMGRAFSPIVNAPTLSAAQVTAVERALAGNPFSAGAVSSHELAALAARAARAGGIRSSEAPQITQMASFYQDFLEPQLAGSRLAPLVMSIGDHVPVIGKYGPRDLPRRGARAPAA